MTITTDDTTTATISAPYDDRNVTTSVPAIGGVSGRPTLRIKNPLSYEENDDNSQRRAIIGLSPRQVLMMTMMNDSNVSNCIGQTTSSASSSYHPQHHHHHGRSLSNIETAFPQQQQQQDQQDQQEQYSFHNNNSQHQQQQNHHYHHQTNHNTTSSSSNSSSNGGLLSRQELNGLNIAGVAVTLLSTIYTLFHPMYVVQLMSTLQNNHKNSNHENNKNDEQQQPVMMEELLQEEGEILVEIPQEQDQDQQEMGGYLGERQLVGQHQQVIRQTAHHDPTILKIIVFCLISPCIIVSIAWFIDYYYWSSSSSPSQANYNKKRKRNRTDLVTVSGWIFAVAFLIPFFIPLVILLWNSSDASTSTSVGTGNNGNYRGNIWSLCLYDTMYTVVTIVLGSALIDAHGMTTKSRIAFMLSSEVMYLLVALITCQFGLPHFYKDNNNFGNGESNSINNEADTELLMLLNDDLDHHGTSKQMRALRPEDRMGSISGFCQFLITMVLLACILFVVAQNMLSSASSSSSIKKASSHHHEHDDRDLEYDDDDPLDSIIMDASNNSNYNITAFTSNNASSSITPTRKSATVISPTKLAITKATTTTIRHIQHHFVLMPKILHDFWKHKNFRIWLVIEVVLKAQNSFISYFLYLLMGRIIAGQTEHIFHHHLSSSTTFSNFGTIFAIAISKQIASILAYVPIIMIGYRKLYQYLFDTTLGLSILVFMLADPSSEVWIVGCAFVITTVTRAVQAAGMYLVMSDLVTEMKFKHRVIDHRENEPSVAALFLGINAFFVKPTRVIFAMIAEAVSIRIQSTKSNDEAEGIPFQTDSSRKILFHCMMFTTALCSIAQILLWNQYDLRPRKVIKMREAIRHNTRWYDSNHQMTRLTPRSTEKQTAGTGSFNF